MTAFATHIEHLDGRVVVELRGEVDSTTASILQQDLRPLLYRYDADQITLDCAALDLMDAIGLAHLVQLSKTFPSGRIKLRNPSPALRALLEATNASAVFDVDIRSDAGALA